MTDKAKTEYEAAIKQLHDLVRSDSLMQYICENRDKSNKQNIPHMWILLQELSITQDDVDELDVIHVTGTKGKGSTCAFTESIIRHHGYKTLFFSSPHVREVRERIRINGKPITYQAFTDYFWEIYNQLKYLKDDDNTVMHFYNFLMVMGVYIGIKEKRRGNVDAVIMEGMVGGEYDYVNIFEHKVACGVSSLGLDHVETLGRTIDRIAWNKAGIFRRDAPAITVQQPEEAMKVLNERAKEKETVLSVCPTLEAFGSDIELGIDGEVQKLNAALALQLSREWLRHKRQQHSEYRNEIQTKAVPAGSCSTNLSLITETERKGLKNCKIIGRCHVVKLEGITIYLDSAHTLESIQHCTEWFEKRCTEVIHSGVSIKKILMIAIPTDRNPDRLLRSLKNLIEKVMTSQWLLQVPPNLRSRGLDFRVEAILIQKRLDVGCETRDRMTSLDKSLSASILDFESHFPFDIAIFPVHVSEAVETSPEHPIYHAPMNIRIDLAKCTKETWDKANQGRIVAGTQRSVFCNSIYEGLNLIMEERSTLIQEDRHVSIQVLVTGGVAFVGKCLRLLEGHCSNGLGV